MAKVKPSKGKVKSDAAAVYVKQFKVWIGSFDRKVLIQHGIITGAFLIFIVFFFLPILKDNKETRDNARRLDSQINAARMVIAKIPELKRRKEVFGERIEKIRNQFFKTEEEDQLIEIISKTATEAGVEIRAVQPFSQELNLAEPFAQYYKASSYELVLEGGYHNVGTFLNLIEENEKNFAVHNFKLVQDKESPFVHKSITIATAFIERYATSQT